MKVIYESDYEEDFIEVILTEFDIQQILEASRIKFLYNKKVIKEKRRILNIAIRKEVPICH